MPKAKSPPKVYETVQRVSGKMNYTHGGFANDVYHTYDVFKVEVNKPKK